LQEKRETLQRFLLAHERFSGHCGKPGEAAVIYGDLLELTETLPQRLQIYRNSARFKSKRAREVTQRREVAAKLMEVAGFSPEAAAI
jgi:hypothetical protein